MGETKKWYRVTDPLNPLFGCDVRFVNVDFDRFTFLKDNPSAFGMIDAMRRVDIFVGDRPFQLIAPEGEDIGLTIRLSHIEESPLQDDVVELSTTQPYGACLDEYECERNDGLTLHIATFEDAVQVALLKGGDLLRTQTHGSLHIPIKIQGMFEDGASADDIWEYMAVCGGGQKDI